MRYCICGHRMIDHIGCKGKCEPAIGIPCSCIEFKKPEGIRKCPEWGCGGIIRDWNGSIDRMGIRLSVAGEVCSKCDTIVYTYDEVERQNRIIAEEMVNRGIVTGKEFKFVRKSLNLSRIKIASLFGLCSDTISKWKNGKGEIPILAAFSLGQLYLNYEDASGRLKKIRKRRKE